MEYRSNIPDTLPGNISQLINCCHLSNNIIQKSENGTAKVLKMMDNQADINELCKLIYSQFKMLQNDFQHARITAIRYQEYLKSFQQLFDLPMEMPEYLKELNSPEISSEVRRYVPQQIIA